MHTPLRQKAIKSAITFCPHGLAANACGYSFFWLNQDGLHPGYNPSLGRYKEGGLAHPNFIKKLSAILQKWHVKCIFLLPPMS